MRRTLILFTGFLLLSTASFAQTVVTTDTNATLGNIPSTASKLVVRLGVSAKYDSAPRYFYPSTIACTISGGDGISQIPSIDNKCWLSSQPSLNAPVYHQGQGAPTLVKANLQVVGDYLWNFSYNPMLGVIAKFTGTPGTGNPGLHWVLPGGTHDTTIPITAADTLTTIRVRMCAAVQADTTLLTLLSTITDPQGQTIGNPIETACANQYFSTNAFKFNAPWVFPTGVTVSGITSGGVTTTIRNLADTSNTPGMDGGPITPLGTRFYPTNYTFVDGDLGPYSSFQVGIGSASLDQIAYANTEYNAARTEWLFKLGTTTDAVQLSASYANFRVPVLVGGSGTPQAGYIGQNGANLLQINDDVVSLNDSANTRANMTIGTGGVSIGAPTGGLKGVDSINIAGTIWTDGTQGLASKSCVAAGATLTITNGLVTATSGC